MNDAQANFVCQQFDLGNDIVCQQLGGTRNRNFLLTTTNGEFFVRHRYSGYCEPARVAFDHEALAYLKARNVAVVAPLRTSAGMTSIQTETGTWEVFPAVSGRPFR